jgi:hypothetical protein
MTAHFGQHLPLLLSKLSFCVTPVDIEEFRELFLCSDILELFESNVHFRPTFSELEQGWVEAGCLHADQIPQT